MSFFILNIYLWTIKKNVSLLRQIMLTVLLWVFILLLGLFFLTYGVIILSNKFLPNRYYQGPISDHFDGRHFYFPGARKRALWEVLTWLLTRKQTSWPKKVEQNHHFPPPKKHTEDDKPQITYIGHSSILLQWKNLNILLDPIYSEKVGPSFLPWLKIARVSEPGIKFEDLPPINVVLITHGHYDHMDIDTLKRLQSEKNPLFISSLGHKRFLNDQEIQNVIEMDWWQKHKIDEKFQIIFLPTKHSSNRSLLDIDLTLWGCFGIELKDHGYILFGGDSAYGPHWKKIQEKLGVPRAALLPIGAYKPRWFMEMVHMNPEEMIEALNDLGDPKGIAIHFGTFPLTDEGIDEPVNALQKLKGTKDIWIPLPGESRQY